MSASFHSFSHWQALSWSGTVFNRYWAEFLIHGSEQLAYMPGCLYSEVRKSRKSLPRASHILNLGVVPGVLNTHVKPCISPHKGAEWEWHHLPSLLHTCKLGQAGTKLVYAAPSVSEHLGSHTSVDPIRNWSSLQHNVSGNCYRTGTVASFYWKTRV